MPFETCLIAYAAFASLTLSMHKHRPKPPLPLMPSPFAARVAGWMLLVCVGVAAIDQFGWAQGMVAGVGQICVGGAVMVLVLSWRPRVALQLAPVALTAGLIGVLV